MSGPRTAFVLSGGASLGALQAGERRLIDGYSGEVDFIVLPTANSRRVQPTDFEQAGRLTAGALAACRELLAEPTLASAA